MVLPVKVHHFCRVPFEFSFELFEMLCNDQFGKCIDIILDHAMVCIKPDHIVVFVKVWGVLPGEKELFELGGNGIFLFLLHHILALFN